MQRQPFSMQWSIKLPLFLLVALILAGCGASSTACRTSSPRGPATTSAEGPVTLTLDHTIYAPDDPIRVLVTNHTTQLIGPTYRVGGNCLVYLIQQQVNGVWPPVPEIPAFAQGQHCHHSEAPNGDFLAVQPGAPVNFPIDAEVRSVYYISWHPGTYRLVFPYMSLDTMHDLDTGWVGHGTSVSPPFQICVCRTCA